MKCRGTASLYPPSRTVILYEVKIKAGEKLRARRNKEKSVRKKRLKLEGRELCREKRLDQTDQGEEGRKAPFVSKKTQRTK